VEVALGFAIAPLCTFGQYDLFVARISSVSPAVSVKDHPCWGEIGTDQPNPSWKPSRWLMSVGREEEAIRSLARLHARGDTNDPFVIHEAAEIKSGVMFEKESEQGWKKVSSRARVRCAE
jgi:hypothetical protein